MGVDKYSLLGWSDGGITALIIAAANQTAVQKLIVFGSNAYICNEDRELLNRIRDLNKWNPKAKQAFIELYGEELFTKMWYSFVDNYVSLDDLCREDLKHITQKCLIIHGDRDPLVAKEHPEYLLKNIKNARLHRFPDGKHNIHQKYAQEFNQMVENFLLEDV